ncbi:MAG: hypothetical protein IKZ82_08300 [Clostridia bacterium]|nr:hypothetical protein [Clostridia bacterium]
MEAKKFLSELKRLCLTQATCATCDLDKYQCPCAGCDYESDIDSIVAYVEEWSRQHPLPRFTRIEADEVVRVYTFEATDIVEAEADPKDLKATAARFAACIKERYDFDDVICTKVQQSITRFHEEEI